MKLHLRNPTGGDADAVLRWRNRDTVRAASISEDLISEDAHRHWFSGQVEAEIPTLQIVEVDDRAVGVVRLEGLDLRQETSGWGCHLGIDQVPPGTGAALPLLGLALGFGRHGLRRMHAEVLGSNKNMRGIHRRLGLEPEGVRRKAARRADGRTEDVLEFGVLRDEWADVRLRAAALLPASIGDALEAATVSLGAEPLQR